MILLTSLRTACYPSIGSRFPFFDAFLSSFAFSHLILDYLVMHLPWNHCRSTSSYLNCMFITRHYSLASSLHPSIMHYHHFHANLYLCQSGMSVMLNDTGFTEFNSLLRELSLPGGHTL
jgi:hypothetical protein